MARLSDPDKRVVHYDHRVLKAGIVMFPDPPRAKGA
jgi:hypothetical protein